MSTPPPTFETPDEQHSWVIMQGAKAAALWGSAGVVGHLLAQRTLPFYQRVSIPYKSFLLVSIPLGAFFTVADRAAMHADRARAQRGFSITRADELQLIEQVARPADDAPWHERAKHFVMENKYSVLGYTWLGTVGVSLAYNFSRRDIAVPQKLINSRMIAQAMVLAGFAGMALIASAAPKPVKIDPHFERVVNQAPAKDTH